MPVSPAAAVPWFDTLSGATDTTKIAADEGRKVRPGEEINPGEPPGQPCRGPDAEEIWINLAVGIIGAGPVW